MAISAYLADVWSATDFGDSELSDYAEAQLRTDTRLGVQTLAGLSVAMQTGMALLIWSLGMHDAYLDTTLLFGLLALHILISAIYVQDTRSLHALGITFLVIGAMTITLLAHRSGELQVGMMAGVVLLFVAVPLVPWALRETGIVIGLAYLMLTVSMSMVPGRFSAESFWSLQLLLFGAAVCALVISGRNTFMRKQDIRARYALENAHSEMQLLMMQDHLTGAWNRRFIDENFDDYARDCHKRGQPVHMAILDIDDFKGINDVFGHQVGDRILIEVADTFVRHLGSKGRLIRLGGDEFQIVYCGDDLDELIESAITELQQSRIAASLAEHREITLSAGIATCSPGGVADAEELYRVADRALYAAKEDRVPDPDDSAMLSRTGSWKL